MRKKHEDCLSGLIATTEGVDMKPALPGVIVAFVTTL